MESYKRDVSGRRDIGSESNSTMEGRAPSETQLEMELETEMFVITMRREALVVLSCPSFRMWDLGILFVRFPWVRLASLLSARSASRPTY